MLAKRIAQRVSKLSFNIGIYIYIYIYIYILREDLN